MTVILLPSLLRIYDWYPGINHASLVICPCRYPAPVGMVTRTRAPSISIWPIEEQGNAVSDFSPRDIANPRKSTAQKGMAGNRHPQMFAASYPIQLPHSPCTGRYFHDSVDEQNQFGSFGAVITVFPGFLCHDRFSMTAMICLVILVIPHEEG